MCVLGVHCYMLVHWMKSMKRPLNNQPALLRGVSEYEATMSARLHIPGRWTPDHRIKISHT